MQIFGTANYMNCDVDCRWYGRAHDVKVIQWSEVRKNLEAQQWFYAAADCEYGLSHVIICPYSLDKATQGSLKGLLHLSAQQDSHNIHWEHFWTAKEQIFHPEKHKNSSPVLTEKLFLYGA